MTFDLKSLIQASGYSGSSGQSFRNHVLGAATGAKLSDYKCTDWTFSGDPAPELTYSDGAHFAISITFSQNSRVDYIKRTGNSISINPGLSPTGFNVTAASSSVVAASAGSAASVTVSAPYNGTRSYSGTAWFDGYISPAQPSDSTSDPVRFQAVVAASGASGSQACSFTFSFAPDSGGFNPTLSHTFSLTMNNRSYSTDASTYLWNWSTTSDFSSIVGTASSYVLNSAPGETHTLYLRGRATVSDVWTNVGAVTFVDPRSMV